MKNIIIRSAVATGTLAISLGLVEIKSTQAALIGYDFVVEITPESGIDKPLAGSKGTGSFIFDDAATPVDDPFGVSYYQVNELTFNFLGNTYTAKDDIGLSEFPGLPYPTVGFQDDEFLGLNYVVTSTSSTNPGFIFTATQPFSSTSQFTAGRGAIAQRNNQDNPISAQGLSIGPDGDPGLSDGQVTYTPRVVPEPCSTLGLTTLGILGIGSILRQKHKLIKKQIVN